MDFGLAMLFITHDIRVAVSIADRIAVMQRGQIVEVAPADVLIRAPKSDYTRTLIASVPGRRDEAVHRVPSFTQRDFA
jgi:peptide/nickel transport system ATP-binding protein